MSANKSSIILLEPKSFLIYLVTLTLSVIVFLSSCTGILFVLHLSYKDWCKSMHQYCNQIVELNSFPSVVDFTDGSNKRAEKSENVEENIPINSDDEGLPENKQQKARKGMTARITKLKVPSDEKMMNIPQDIIEIEPNKFVEKISKKDHVLRDPGPDKELGRISFCIEYNAQSEELQIGNIHIEALRKKNSQAILNPFIVIYIWPDNAWPVKTTVIKKTNSPRWEESVVYEQFDLSYMIDKALHFKIQTWNPLRPNELIGHVVIPLRVIKNLTKGIFEAYFMKNLQPDLQINRGSIKFILLYKEVESDETKGDILVSILKANLIYPSTFISDQCQVFIKVSVIHPDHPIESKFTSIQRGSFQPVWREGMTFKVPRHKIMKLSIIISVREESFSKEGKLFAKVELGPEHSELNNTHLRTVLKKPNKMVTQWHQLISNIP